MRSARVDIALIAVTLLVWSGVATAAETGTQLPGDPQRGMRVFFEKKCAACHAVLGEGEKTAPDLGNSRGGHMSASQMAGVMWNHAPRMWERMRVEGIDLPEIDQQEMSDLFSFLYSVRYFDEAGDAGRGSTVFQAKHCASCHAVPGEEGGSAPDLGEGDEYASPVLWVQKMWNHAPAMAEHMDERGLSWPEFSGTDMVDLLAYIRSVAPPQRKRIYLTPPDPVAGAALFAKKGCDDCHAMRGKGGGVAPDLGVRETAFPRTLSQLAGRMWNHAPGMWRAAELRKAERPEFSEREMADLIAYLYSARFFEARGDSRVGARVFEQKKCATCHSGDGPGSDLSEWRGKVTPISLSFVMWKHGPAMFSEMKERGIPWPRFEGSEIVDLMAHLNNGEGDKD